jgi:hypothetical protein
MADTVLVTKGETLRFPVEATHPLAKYQTFQSPSEYENVHGLAILQTMKKTTPTITDTQLSQSLQEILDGSLLKKIVVLQLPGNIYVEPGANLVFGGPVTSVLANNVTVQGTITISGSFNLTCNQLGG